MERLRHFRYMDEEGDNCEDYENSGYDKHTRHNYNIHTYNDTYRNTYLSQTSILFTTY